jgi:hypothetical protein
MITASEFRKEEYWLIKWPLVSLVLSLCLCGGLFVALSSLDSTATADLRRARDDLDLARQSVGKIEEEEATIIEYTGRYQQMVQEGVIADEDRLQLQETIAELRNEFSLFPVVFNIETQTSLALQYDPARGEPGRPIALRTSLVDVGLPLLHEDDLARLLHALIEAPGMLQPLRCSLSLKNSGTDSFINLAQHFDAACTLQWYTFALPPNVVEAEQ